MKKISLLIIAVAFATILQAQKQPDAEYQLIRRTYVVNNDGSMDVSYRKELKLLRNRAITAYADKGETFIVYNPEYESLRINESYTLRPDGAKIATPKNAFVEQLPSSCTGCARLAGIREMAIIHTALEYDAVIVLDYTIHKEKGCTLEEALCLSEDCPVQKSEIIVTLPDDMELQIHEKNLPSKSYALNDNNAYHLVVMDIPQNYSEPYLPASDKVYPTIYFTNNINGTAYNTGKEVLKVDATMQRNFEGPDDMAKIAKVRDYVVDHIRNNHIPMALLNHQPASAQEIFQSGCGNTLEKNIVLAALLRGQGYDASVEIPYKSLQKQDAYRDEYIQFAQTERAFVRVVVDGIPYRLSATEKQAIQPAGLAKDITDTLKVDRQLKLDEVCKALEGGYLSLTLPNEPGAYRINAASLSSNRQAPMQAKRVREDYHYTIPLPEGTQMVGKAIKIKKHCAAGSIEIRIRQKGNQLDVVRKLSIEERIIQHAQYKAFRAMMIDWESYNGAILKK